MMTRAEQALTEAIGEGYRVVITDHAEYNMLFFDKDKVLLIGREYVKRLFCISEENNAVDLPDISYCVDSYVADS